MKRSHKNRLLVFIFLVLSLIAALLFYWNFTVHSQLIQSNDKYIEDFNGLVDTLEQSHPAFEMAKLPQDYEVQKKAIQGLISVMTHKEDFPLLVSLYLSLLNDSHTRLLKPIINDHYFLEIQPDCHAQNKQLYFTSKSEPETKEEILTIGGIPIKDIYKTIDRYVPAENQLARDYNHRLYATNREILWLSGCVIETESLLGDQTIETKGTFSKVGELADEPMERDLKFSVQSIPDFKPSMEQIASKKLEDVYYLDMNLCLDNSKMAGEIEKLRRAIDSGFYKIIIDVRDNAGGNSEVCRKLLNAMGMENPTMGEYVRYSPLAHEAYKVYPITGNSNIEADVNVAIPNSKIQLVVLMNDHTYSSGLWLPVYVQDGKLGVVVGSPSINAPSHYGDILKYKLPNSKVEVSISHKYFKRPNLLANQELLMPDYIPEIGVDSLDFALAYLAGK